MKLNENLESLFTKYAPKDAVLLDFIERRGEYIVLYRDDGDAYTPYVVHHLNDSGLHYGRYYNNSWNAWGKLLQLEFHTMK